MASGIEKYILDRGDYTPLQPPGLQLPGWFFNVQPHDFYQQYNNQLGIQSNEENLLQERLSTQSAENQADYNKAKKEVASQELSYDELLGKLKEAAAKHGDVPSVLEFERLNENRAKAAAEAESKKQPKYNIESGYIWESRPGEMPKMVQKLPEKPEKGERRKLTIDLYNQGGEKVSVNALDPMALQEASDLGFTYNTNPKPKLGLIDEVRELMQQAQGQETAGRAIRPQAAPVQVPTPPPWMPKPRSAPTVPPGVNIVGKVRRNQGVEGR